MGHLFNKVNDQLEIQLFGQIDLSSTQSIKAEFDGLISGDISKVIIEAKELEYIDSSGVAVLLAIKRRCAQVGSAVSIKEISQAGFRVIELAKLESLLPIEKISKKDHLAVESTFNFPAGFMHANQDESKDPINQMADNPDLPDFKPGSFL